MVGLEILLIYLPVLIGLLIIGVGMDVVKFVLAGWFLNKAIQQPKKRKKKKKGKKK